MRRLSLVSVVAAAALMVAPTGAAQASHVVCGQMITQDTTLDENLNCTGDGLIIGAPRITLDGNGFTIDGDDGPDTGIDTNGYDGLTIRGVTVQDFGAAGILLSGTSRSTLTFLAVVSNGGFGGIALFDSHANTLDFVSAISGNTGVNIFNSNRNRIFDGDFNVNSDVGIVVVGNASGTKILDAGVIGNGGDGIFVGSETRRTLLEGNTANANTGDGIDVDSAQTTITSNTANSNSGWGIIAVPGVRDGGGNTASFNTAGNCQNVSCP